MELERWNTAASLLASSWSWSWASGLNCAQGATGLKQRGAKSLGEFPKRLAIPDGPRLGHAIEIKRWDELGVHGEGGGRRQVELIDLLPHITRDERDGRLHFRHDTLGFLDALQAALAEPFVLGNSTNLLDVRLDIRGNELAVSTHTALKIDKMVGMADGADALGDLLALLGEALMLTTGRFERLLRLAPDSRAAFGGRPGPRFSGSSPVVCRWRLHLLELLLRFGWRPCGQLALWWPSELRRPC